MLDQTIQSSTLQEDTTVEAYTSFPIKLETNANRLQNSGST